MKILIVQLSDLHFKSNNNELLNRIEKIGKAILSSSEDVASIFIVINGDIAFSGSEVEYKIANEFLLKLLQFLEGKNLSLKLIIIPGNHDCVLIDKDTARQIIINRLSKEGDGLFDESIMNNCCTAQNNFFEFKKIYDKKQKVTFSNKLLTVYEYEVEEHKIIFYAYNTAWVSQNPEIPGIMYYPIKKVNKRLFITPKDLSISVLHHPLHWQIPDNRRIMQGHIEQTSNIILTGHEHIPTKSLKDDFEGNQLEYIEGGVLQDSSNSNLSSFNLIKIDIENKLQKIFTFSFDGNIYRADNIEKGWVKINLEKNSEVKVFRLAVEFENYLDDPGAAFRHPNKSNLSLEDIFVFPDFLDQKLQKSKDQVEVINADSLEFNDDIATKLLIMSSEKSGKTALSKMLFKKLLRKGFIPLLLNGTEIKSASLEDFRKLIDQSFKNQYRNDSLDEFKQLDQCRKFILIDDFDKSRVNLKYKIRLVQNISSEYKNLIFTTGDLFLVQEFFVKDSGEELFQEFKQFGLLEFGHRLREKLIRKWLTIGNEEFEEEMELVKKIDKATNVIDTIIGKNFIPSVPIFLLTMLQTLEAAELNLKASSYGYYYEYLITNSLKESKIRKEEIDSYYNFLSELANHLFENRSRLISENDFRVFHVRYEIEYQIKIDMLQLIELLIKSDILEKYGASFKFKYKYVYYYFEAKHIANNITKSAIKERIKNLCARLYREEFSNIILFLVHLSKDPIILEEILDNAKNLLSEVEPIGLDNDIGPINSLLNKLPLRVLEERQYTKTREEVNEKKDREEILNHSKEDKEVIEEDASESEEIAELDFISKLNLTAKVTEILGQILKNYFGSLKGNAKLEIGEQAYFLGLRSLNAYLLRLEQDMGSIVKIIESLLTEKKLVKSDEIEDYSKKLFFMICTRLTFSFIKKISSFVGSSNLSKTYDSILERNPRNSIRLIDMSIKLDFYDEIPFQQIKELKDILADNYLAYDVLRRLMIDYIYMFPVSIGDKQKICSLLDIPVDVQRAIDLSSTQKRIKK